MTRGNQREMAREKAMKKQKGAKDASKPSANAGLTLEQHKQCNADVMPQNQEKKAQQAAENAAGKK